ncbi:MAG: ATP synthase F1 subunit delta [Bacteroidota bacterium]
MSNTRLAIRYATPILELADQKGVLEEVKNDMQMFLDLCKSNRDLELMLKSPIIPHLRKSEILKMIFSTKFNALTLQAFNVITRKAREKYLPDIAKVFVEKYNVKKGLQSVTITTAVPLSDELRKEFRALVKKITNKESLITEKVSPELIGGYVLKMDDQQLDESISGHLKDLELKFKNETI